MQTWAKIYLKILESGGTLSLKAILEEYGENRAIQKSIFLFENVSQEKSVIDEVICFSRLRGEYSQQELSEGICTPETLSRIETGKRNPTVKNFYALMQKLEIGMGYYNTELDVEKFETLEKISKMKRAMILKNFIIWKMRFCHITATVCCFHVR